MPLAVIAALMLAPTILLAQGGAQQRRARTAAVAEGAATSAATKQLAGELLKTLAGSWRFEVRFAGNFTGAPDGTGKRVFEPLFDSLRLQWRETVDSSGISSEGILGFDPNNGQFYGTTVYSSSPGVELLTGSLDLAEPFVAFRPMAPDGASFTLRVVDQDHFTWAPVDRSWRAVFTRVPTTVSLYQGPADAVPLKDRPQTAAEAW